MTGAYHYTSRGKLNTALGWVTIEKHVDILGLKIFQKYICGISTLIQQRVDY